MRWQSFDALPASWRRSIIAIQRGIYFASDCISAVSERSFDQIVHYTTHGYASNFRCTLHKTHPPFGPLITHGSPQTWHGATLPPYSGTGASPITSNILDSITAPGTTSARSL